MGEDGQSEVAKAARQADLMVSEEMKCRAGGAGQTGARSVRAETLAGVNKTPSNSAGMCSKSQTETTCRLLLLA